MTKFTWIFLGGALGVLPRSAYPHNNAGPRMGWGHHAPAHVAPYGGWWGRPRVGPLYGYGYPSGDTEVRVVDRVMVQPQDNVPARPPAEPKVIVVEHQAATAPSEARPPVGLSDIRPQLEGAPVRQLGINQTAQGQPLNIAGQTYVSGFAQPANSLLSVLLPLGYHSLHAMLGVDAADCLPADDTASGIRFVILGDDKPLLTVETLRPGSPATPIDVTITDIKRLSFHAIGAGQAHCLLGVIAFPRASM